MTKYLTTYHVLEIHCRLIQELGGSMGVRDWSALESALAQPRLTFAGKELYPTIIEKAAAIGFSLVQNHPFVDGNKRTAHAAMEIFLVLNGYEINAPVDDQENVMLQVASGEMSREAFVSWLRAHTQPKNQL